MEKSVWVIEAVVKKTFKVSFEGDVNRDDAIEMFETGEYDDILDESDIDDIVEIIDAE